MSIEQKALIALVVMVLSIISYFLIEKLERKKYELGSSSGMFRWGRMACIALLILSGLAIGLLSKIFQEKEGDELFYELKQRCEFISLTLPEGASMIDGGIGTFECDGKQVDVPVSGEVFKSQLREIVEKGD